MHLHIEPHNRIIIRIRGILSSLSLGNLDIPLHGQIALDELDAGDGDPSRIGVRFDFIGGQGGKRGFDYAEVGAEFATEDGPVGYGAVFDAGFGFVGGEDDVADVEFGFDIALEGADVFEVLRVGVEDKEFFERCL